MKQLKLTEVERELIEATTKGVIRTAQRNCATI